ncbi:hypothetical protein, partial [Methylophaga sp. UBA5088]
ATVFGVGQDKNITTSAIKALLNGVNRFMNTGTSVAVDKKAVS